MSDEHKGIIYAFASGVCYGLTGFLGVTLVHSGLSIANMLFWRFLISSLVLAVFLIPKYRFFKEIHHRFSAYKIILYGFIFYATSSIAFFASSSYVGTGIATVILFTYPAIVVFFNAIFNRASVHYGYYIAVLIVIIGVILLSDIGDLNNLAINIIGIGLGLLSSLLYAFYIIASKRILSSPIFSTLMVSIGCTFCCLFIAYFESTLRIPSSWQEVGYLLLMAILCTLLPILLLLKALEYINPMKAAILSVLEPVFMLIFGVLLLGEQISNIQAIGIITVLSGALLVLFL